MLVFGKIPHRAMATGVEDGIEVFLPDAVEPKGLVELSFCSCVLLEPERKVCAELGFIALGVERRSSTLRGRERDLNAGVLEGVIGSGELLEPEPGLSS